MKNYVIEVSRNYEEVIESAPRGEDTIGGKGGGGGRRGATTKTIKTIIYTYIHIIYIKNLYIYAYTHICIYVMCVNR